MKVQKHYRMCCIYMITRRRELVNLLSTASLFESNQRTLQSDVIGILCYLVNSLDLQGNCDEAIVYSCGKGVYEISKTA